MNDPTSIDGNHEPTSVPYSALQPIVVEDLDEDALKIVRRLWRHGYQAYFVGGCVRDLLVGGHPKDFDIATDARPRQVKRLFRNSRIIGRRFKLVHVTFREHKVIEVSTFRKSPDEEQGSEHDGLIVRDNTFGTLKEDALRRDFTINALFYDTECDEVIDYVEGERDLERSLVRTIGDPWLRLREDPVRMLRAVKFATRLNFEIEDELHEAIVSMHQDILKSSPPRVLEELLRLLSCGASSRAFRLLHQTYLLDALLPDVAEWIENGTDDEDRFEILLRRLEIVDELDGGRRRLSNPIFLSVLFAGPIEERLEAGDSQVQDIEEIIEELLGEFSRRSRLSRREMAQLRAIQRTRLLIESWGQKKRRPSLRKLVNRPAFREAFLLFEILCTADEKLDRLESWKQRLEDLSWTPRSEGDSRPRPPRRRRRRRPPAS